MGNERKPIYAARDAVSGELSSLTEFKSDDLLGVVHGGTGVSSLAELELDQYASASSLEGVSSTVFDNSASWASGGGGVTDHGALTGLGDDDHPQYVLSSTNANLSSTVSDLETEFDGVSSTVFDNSSAWGTDTDTTDHTALSNIGTNTHAQIDSHLADSSEHFTEASIDHGSIAGLGDDDHPQYVLSATNETLSSTVDTLDTEFTAVSSTVSDTSAIWGDSGTSFPGSPVEGQKFYRTDLDGEYYYDSSRSKWLSTHIYSFQGTYLGALTNAYDYLDAAQIPYSASLGHVAPVDLCIVEGSIVTAGPSTCTVQLRDDGSSVATVSLSSATVAYDSALNSSTIASGSVVSLYISGTATGGHVAVFHARRVAT